MSFESRGFPLAVCLPAMTQLLEPAWHPAQSGKPSRARNSRKIAIGKWRRVRRRDESVRSSSSLSAGAVGMRLGQVDDFAGGRMIAPGADGVEVRLELAGCCSLAAICSRASLASQWVSSMSTIIMPMLMESAPVQGCGLYMKHAKLGRQRVLVLRDVEVHAARIGFKAGAIVRGQVGIDAVGSDCEAEDALRLIVLEQRSAEDLGQFAIGVAAVKIHLPEAILRRDVALGDEHVFLRGASM